MMHCEGMATNAVCDSVFYFLLIQKKNVWNNIFKTVKCYYFRDYFAITI